MAIDLLFILTIKDKRVIMIITKKIVRSTFLFIFSDPEVLFPLCFECKDCRIMFSKSCLFFLYKDHMNMSFHGNQIEDIVAILLPKKIY